LKVDERIRIATQFLELGVTRECNDDEKKKANIITLNKVVYAIS
jgi:hypothetical protein